jgi:hypothetical protein
VRILVLGVDDHRIQDRPRGFLNPQMEQHRRDLETLLSQTVVNHHVSFIGEETYPERETIARVVAGRYNVRWSAIEMPLEMREQLGIAEDQKRRPLPPHETRVASDALREEYMVKTALEKCEDASTMLIVCGSTHASALAEKFRSVGCEAQMIK